MTRRSLCHALLVLNVGYCTAALFIPDLPGWKMFERVEPLPYQLRDARGQAIDVRDYLPRHAYLIDERQLRRVARFISVKDAQRGPFSFRAHPDAASERLERGSFETP